MAPVDSARPLRAPSPTSAHDPRPGTHDRAINKLIRTTRRLVQELGREPTSEEIAMRIVYVHRQVGKILKFAQQPISIQTPIGRRKIQPGRLHRDKAVARPRTRHQFEPEGADGHY